MSQYSPHQVVVEPAERDSTNYNAEGRQDRMLLGVLLMMVGETILVAMGASIKHLSENMPLPQMMLFRNLFALLFVLPFVLRIGMHQLRSPRIHLHFQRAVLGVMAMFCMFYSFSVLRLSEAVLLKATAPILVSLMAWMLLRERLSGLGWLAILIAFFGVASISAPQWAGLQALEIDINLGIVAGLTGALLVATAKIWVRRLGRSEATEVIVFYFAAFASLFTLPFALWLWQPIASVDWAWLLFIALLATLGQLCLTKAYTVVRVGKVAMFSYLSLPIAGFSGWLLWDETMDMNLIIGSLIIVSAGALSFYTSVRTR